MLPAAGGRERRHASLAGVTATLNGQVLTRDSNTFTINGTAFTLHSSGTATVTVAKDTDTAVSNVQAFVDQYNETLQLLNEKLTSDDSSLEGDSRLKAIRRRLGSTIYTNIENPGTMTHLTELGLAVDHTSSDRTLTFDTTELIEAIEAGAADVFDLFAYNTDADGVYDDGGFANLVDDYLENYTKRFSGYIVEHNELIEDRIDTLDRRIDRMEDQLERKEERLTEEYERLFEAFQQLLQSLSAMSLLLQGSNTSSYSSLL